MDDMLLVTVRKPGVGGLTLSNHGGNVVDMVYLLLGVVFVALILALIKACSLLEKTK